MFRFRLRTLFLATAFVATTIFVGSHLSIAGDWTPANASYSGETSYSLQIRWDSTDVLDMLKTRSPGDGEPYFHLKLFDDCGA